MTSFTWYFFLSLTQCFLYCVRISAVVGHEGNAIIQNSHPLEKQHEAGVGCTIDLVISRRTGTIYRIIIYKYNTPFIRGGFII